MSCRAFTEVLAGRCDDAWTQIETLGSGFVNERIRSMLFWLTRKIGVWTPAGIEVKVTQSQLAQMIGSTRESLNRQIKLLKKEGVLSVSQRATLLILDPNKLTAVQCV